MVTWLSHVVVSVVPSWVATRTHYLRYISHTLWLHDSWVAVQFTPTPRVMDLANRIVRGVIQATSGPREVGGNSAVLLGVGSGS